MAEDFLVGHRLRLRPLEREDLQRYQELSRDPEINMFYGGLGIPDTLSKLQRRHDAGEFDFTDRQLYLVIEVEEVLIGHVYLGNDENFPSRAATFGICIGEPEYLGRGYGAEATALALDYAFAVLGYHKVNLDLFEYNTRALATYEKLGFVHEGRRRENHFSRGRFWDEILLGIAEDEWRERRGPPSDPRMENE